MSHPDYQYWYAFCFLNTSETGIVHGSCYLGIDVKGVRVCDIKEAKETAKMPSESVMLSCSFLGLMTREAFVSEDIDRAAEG